MVSRNLTEVFVLMRNNAIHSRQIFFEQGSDTERVRLMRSGSRDLEGGSGARDPPPPPPWADALEEAHYIISRLKSKIAELQECQDRQIKRPSLDDTSDQQKINRLANEIGKQFTNVHRNCAAIKAYTRQGTPSEQKLVKNVVIALATTLQELSITFRTAQSNYLKSLTTREERSKALFELPNFEELSLNDNSDLLPGLNDQTDLLFSLPSTSGKQTVFMDEENIDDMFERQAVNQKQLLLIEEENTRMIAERESDVNKIVHSILDLNEVFKDLAHMVHDQGTILDRIDYNIEQTQYQVHEGFKQLQKADRYQKKNRKMHCILILGVMIVILAMLLVIVKS